MNKIKSTVAKVARKIGLSNLKISVVIPLYNSEEYIGECLDSLVKQKFKFFEVIVVNDGSTDTSLSIVNKYSDKLNLTVLSQNNAGASAARNKGVRHAKCEYLAFVDSDDIVPENSLSDMYACIKENESDVVIGKRGRLIKGKEKLEKGLKATFNKPLINASVKEHPELLYVIAVHSKLFKRSFLVDNNITFYEGISSEDFIFTYEVLLASDKISTVCDRYVYLYRVRDGVSLSITQQRLSTYNLQSRFIQMDRTYEIANTEKGKAAFKRNEARVNFQVRLMRHILMIDEVNPATINAFNLIKNYIEPKMELINSNCNELYREIYKSIHSSSIEELIVLLKFLREINRLKEKIKSLS